MAGCGAGPPRAWPDPAPPAAPSETLHLVGHDWHTEIALPASAAAAASPLGPALLPRFPGARSLLFGYGLRRYFTHANPGSADLLAALAPGPAATRVSALRTTPAEAFDAAAVIAVPVSAEGLARLLRFLWDELEKDVQGRPVAIAEATAPPGGRFFAAVTPYDLGYTCNTWTVLALRVAGLAVDPSGVVRAGPAMDRVRAAVAAAPARR